MTKVFSLCPACSACPAVEVEEHKGRIGEGDNLVALSAVEWNRLVEAIKTGDLHEIGQQ